ncbi:MAG: acyltransferase family protein [Deltaproteobacteria bacterium]|nr:acyltransferase family protein [Deltaproteobacteria bacterium]
MSPERRYDIDWLRVFATYLLLLFHVGMVFNPAPFYHVRNTDVSFVFLVVCGFIGLWHMPLFFLLAGWSASSSLALRGSGGFLRERFFRLCVPLVAACVLLMPAIKYLELSNGLDANYSGLYVDPRLQESFRQVIPTGLPVAAPFDQGFLEFLPSFFTDLSRFTWGHLWFVAYLLTFTVLYLPLFVRLGAVRQWPGGRVSPLWVYAPIVPLALVQVTMRERWPGLQNLIDDWANFACYSIYLVAGFLLARCTALETAVHREWRRAFAIGLTATLLLLLAVLQVFSSAALTLALTAIAGWCFVVAFLGWSHRHLAFQTPALSYLAESAFPVYLLHQAAIVIPGYFLIQLPLGVWSKFVILLLVSSSLTISAYHFLVRPFAVPRFLCGMKGRAQPARRRLAAAATAALLLVGSRALRTTAAANEARPLTPSLALGRWYAEGGAAQVEIAPCGAEVCGRIAWLRSPFDENGCELHDRNNPDAALQARAVVGLEVLRASARAADGDESGGCTIYDPVSGRTYRCQMWPDGEDRLRLRGYLGVPLFGRTTTWLRVGSESRTCQQRSGPSVQAADRAS